MELELTVTQTEEAMAEETEEAMAEEAEEAVATETPAPAGEEAEMEGAVLPTPVSGVAPPTPTGPQLEPLPEAALGDQELIELGEQRYEFFCSACHQPDGQGVGPILPLDGSGLVIFQDPEPLIETVLLGRAAMPAFQGDLSPREIATILSFVRNNWGNQASVVQADQVEEVLQRVETEQEAATE
jgi:mono/diheme cytochrome c family protein